MLSQYLCRSQAFGAIFRLPKLIPLNFSAGASTYWNSILPERETTSLQHFVESMVQVKGDRSNSASGKMLFPAGE